MLTTPMIRSAAAADAPAITALLRDLGYPGEPDRVSATLRQLLDDPSAFVVVAVDDDRGVVGLLSLSCRPVLRLQGVAATIEELAVRSDARARGGRLILKRSTGALMALWPGGAFAAGDIRTNLNQGINLVNNCYAKAVLRRGHVLLHASAVVRDQRAAVLAGPPGAGKSTSALHLVEAGFHCLSNDRVLAKPFRVVPTGLHRRRAV